MQKKAYNNTIGNIEDPGGFAIEFEANFTRRIGIDETILARSRGRNDDICCRVYHCPFFQNVWLENRPATGLPMSQAIVGLKSLYAPGNADTHRQRPC